MLSLGTYSSFPVLTMGGGEAAVSLGSLQDLPEVPTPWNLSSVLEPGLGAGEGQMRTQVATVLCTNHPEQAMISQALDSGNYSEVRNPSGQSEQASLLQPGEPQ